MENEQVMTEQQATDRINSSNVDEAKAAINAVLSGQIKKEEPVTAPIAPTASVEPVVTSEPVVEAQPNTDPLEQARKYSELMMAEARSKNEQVLRDKINLENQINEEKQKRTELEARLRQMEEQRHSSAPAAESTATEEDFLPDYAKQQAEKIKQLELKLQNSENPGFQEFRAELDALKKDRIAREELQKIEAEKLKIERNKEKIYGEVSQLQEQYEDLKTNKPFNKIADEFLTFRKDLGVLLKCRTTDEVDVMVNQFFDPNSGKALRDKAAEYGIKPPEETDKFQKVIEYIDTKNGVRYDPILKKYVDITDGFGNRVRYASLDDVYKIKNFNRTMSSVKKQTATEVGERLSQLEDSVGGRIDNSETIFPTNKVSEAQAEQLINADPASYWNNPKAREMVRKAYEAQGIPAPTYKNQKM